MWLRVRRRVAKSTGATVVTTLADMEGNETFEASALGSADEVGSLHGMYWHECIRCRHWYRTDSLLSMHNASFGDLQTLL